MVVESNYLGLMEWLIHPPPPFDWRLKLRFLLLPERPTPQVVRGDEWLRAFRIGGRLIPVSVRSVGSVEKPALKVLTDYVSEDERGRINSLLCSLLGLGDVKNLYDFMERDEVLRSVKRRLYGFGRAWLMAASVFEGVVKAIVQQQISLRVAENITANIVERYGEKVDFRGGNAYDFPTPETIASLSLEELRNCGLSFRKAEYIKEFSERVVEGFNPEELRGMQPEEILETLTSFRGIGRWTAELVMAATIGLNVIPADDLGVRKALSHFYFKGELQPPEVIRRFAEEKFGEHLRDVTVYLLMAYRMESQQHGLGT